MELQFASCQLARLPGCQFGGQDNKASCTFTRPIQKGRHQKEADGPEARPAIWLYFMRGARLKMQSTSPRIRDVE